MYRVTSNISNVYKTAVGIDNDLAPKANELILFPLYAPGYWEEGIGTREFGWDIEEEVSPSTDSGPNMLAPSVLPGSSPCPNHISPIATSATASSRSRSTST